MMNIEDVQTIIRNLISLHGNQINGTDFICNTYSDSLSINYIFTEHGEKHVIYHVYKSGCILTWNTKKDVITLKGE